MNENAHTRSMRREMHHDETYNYIVRPATRSYRDPLWDRTGTFIAVAFCAAIVYLVVRFAIFAVTGH